MSVNENEPLDPLENRLSCSTNFDYPEDVLAPDIWELVQYHVTASMVTQMSELLTKLANFVLPAENPRLALAALFFASDVDLSYILQCSNTETDIAKKLGIGKQTMNTQLKKIRQEFNLTHSTTINHGVTQETYRNNAKKLSTQ